MILTFLAKSFFQSLLLLQFSSFERIMAESYDLAHQYAIRLFMQLIHLMKSCTFLGIIYFGQISDLQLSILLVHNKNIYSNNQIHSKHVVEHIALEVNWNRGPLFSSPSCRNAKQPKQGTPFCRPPNKILASIYIIITAILGTSS